MTVIRYCI